MKLLKKKHNKLNEGEQQRIEGLLISTIKPVVPNLTFVESLEQRLRIDPESLQAESNRSRVNYIVMIGAIVLAITMVTVASIRIAIALIGLIGLVQQFSKDIDAPLEADRSFSSR